MYENMYYNAANGYYGSYPNPTVPEPMKPALMTQPLTQEEMSILTDKGGAFSIKVTQEDMYKAYCTHKKNGSIVATSNPDGTFTCPICGETFEFRSMDKDSITEDINKVIDDMQTIKLTFLDIGTEVARQYFPIIPLLKKLPQLASMAAANWAKYESPNYQDPNVVSPYGMAAYNQLMGGGAMMGMYGGAMQAMPMMGQPIMAQQPVYLDAYGRPMQTAPQTATPQGQVPYPMGVVPQGAPAATSNPAQAAMMMSGGNEFVAPAGVVYPTVPQGQMVTPPIMMPGAVAPGQVQAAAPQQQQLAPTTYQPQPQVTVNVTSGQPDKDKDKQAPVPPTSGQPVVEVSSFKV